VLMGGDMKDIGLMMSKMDLGQKNGMMEALIRVIMIWEKRRDMGNILGVMEVFIKDIGEIINCVEKVCIIILMEKNLLGNIIII